MTERRPRFSILLPTRNGASYLPGCIESVLEQDHPSFELVISDNANTDGTAEVLERYRGDSRVRLVRSEALVDVVENWNRALSASTGEYVLMIGDDDCLLPGCLAAIDDVAKRHGDPGCITYDAYSYFASGSFEQTSQTYYRAGLYTFDATWVAEKALTKDDRMAIVRKMFHFTPTLPLNMQTTVVARRQVEGIARRVAGGMFQRPFPDHYALNALLLNTDSWVVTPKKLVAVGVSPKSFGHFYYTHQQSAGIDYLGITTGFEDRLPGSELTNNMHVWLRMLQRDFPESLTGIEVSRGAYVRRQVYAWLLQFNAGSLTSRELRENIRQLSTRDWLSLVGFLGESATWVHVRRLLRGAGVEGAQTIRYGLRLLPDEVPDIKAFSLWISTAPSSLP